MLWLSIWLKLGCMKILYTISISLLAVSFFRMIYGLWSYYGATHNKKCTVKAEATLIRMTESTVRDAVQNFIIEFEADGVLYQTSVPPEVVEEGTSYDLEPGAKLTIWYDPDNPNYAIISEDQTMPKTVKSAKKTIKSSLIWLLISFIFTVLTISRI